MTLSTAEVQLALDRLMAEAFHDSRLVSEMARARREFSGVEPLPGQPAAATSAANARFAEWYLLERESDVLGEPPARTLLRSVDSRADSPLTLLLGSLVGVFMVESASAAADDADPVDTPRTVPVRDLQTSIVHDLRLQPHLELVEGDVVVGRMFDDGADAWLPSAAVAVQPQGHVLAAAFQRDVQGLGLDRRLTQAEMEHLLFLPLREAAAASRQEVPLEHLEADLQRMLHGAGRPDLDATEISGAFADTDKAGAVMGPLLDELAFDTEIDLENVRRLLLAIWSRRRPAPAEASDDAPLATTAEATDEVTEPLEPPRAGETLGQALARRIEDGMDRHESVDDIFDDVASMLGDDAPQDDGLVADDVEPNGNLASNLDGNVDGGLDAGDAEGVDIFEQGDLSALVQEFIWEEQCTRGPEKGVLTDLLRDQELAPVPKVDLEALEAADLLRFLVRTYLGAPPAVRARLVLQAFGVLERFYGWSRRTQEYELSDVLEDCRVAFIEHLERVHAASLALTRQGGRGGCEREPELLRVIAVGERQLEVAPCTSTQDREPLRVQAPPVAVEILEGDLVLAALAASRGGDATLAGMVVVLPGTVEALLGA